MLRLKLMFACLLTAAACATAEAELYSGFNPARQDRFACRISSRVAEYLNKTGKTYPDVMGEVGSRLKAEIALWAPAVSFNQLLIGTTKLFYSDSDYFLQNAFINTGRINVSALPDENWFGAYLFLSAKLETQYRLNESKAYNLSTDPDLKERISELLPATKNLVWPRFTEDDGRNKIAMFNCRKNWYYGEICSSATTQPLGDPEHPQYAAWIKAAQSANLIASPLFLWVLEQPNGSVTYEALFDRAVAQYENPIVALGVITWMMMADADMGSRRRGAILSKRIEPVLYSSDLAGNHYHFWGFVLKSLYGEGAKYRLLSYVHERLVQGDRPDWEIDNMAITFGDKILARIKNPELCK